MLVFSLFDFRADWFESRWQPSADPISKSFDSLLESNSTLVRSIGETASVGISAWNEIKTTTTAAAWDTARRGVIANIPASMNGFEWLRSVLEKRQVRIPCVDVLVRL